VKARFIYRVILMLVLLQLKGLVQ